MKLTKNTLAATFAALLIGGLAISPASAAVKGSDLTAVTHGSAQEKSNPFGPVAGKQYSRSDIAAVTHQGSGENGRISANQFRWSELGAVTNK
jgi:hypothetical protein